MIDSIRVEHDVEFFFNKPRPSGAPSSPRQMTGQMTTRFHKRKATQDRNESSRCDRLLDSSEFTKRSRPAHSDVYMRSLNRAIAYFCKFTEVVLNSEPGHRMIFFYEGHSPPPMSLLKQFVAWYTDSGHGSIATSSWQPSMTITNTALSVASVSKMAMDLIAGFIYWNSVIWRGTMGTEMRNQICGYIKNELQGKLDLVRSVKTKVTTLQADVEILVNCIWDYQSSAVFKKFQKQVECYHCSELVS